MPFKPVLLALFLTGAAGTAEAASAISCHCFKDRAFDRSRPAAADAYILATAQSSFLAAAFRVEKKDLVRARMTGTSAEDLWIAQWLGARSRESPDRLQTLRGAKRSWAEALQGIRLDPARVPASFLAKAAAGASDGELAAEAADLEIVSAWPASGVALKGLRLQGTTTPEAILSLLLASRTGRMPSEIVDEVRGGRQSWGALLDASGLAPKGVEQAIRSRFPPPER
jgi:hypothetical protein